jgi:hypothetical protein
MIVIVTMSCLLSIFHPYGQLHILLGSDEEWETQVRWMFMNVRGKVTFIHIIEFHSYGKFHHPCCQFWFTNFIFIHLCRFFHMYDCMHVVNSVWLEYFNHECNSIHWYNSCVNKFHPYLLISPFYEISSMILV